MSVNAFKGDFLGFSFNGIHSSDLNIVRINTGSRADMPLSPNFKDSTVEIPGANGIYYFDTQIQQFPFTINFAYDNINEEKIIKIREFFSPNNIGTFIFDESPYQTYTAKVSAVPKLTYLVFTENNDRIYKGEGVVAFVAYTAYGKALYKTLDQYTTNGYDISEWKNASRILTSTDYSNANYNRELSSANNQMTSPLYNAGNLKSPLKFNFSITSLTENTNAYIQLVYSHNTTNTKIILDTTNLTINTTYSFNSETQLITDSQNNVINNIIVAGKFINIEPSDSSAQLLTLSVTNCVATISNIQYDYLYL